jgi:hypothetical protein
MANTTIMTYYKTIAGVSTGHISFSPDYGAAWKAEDVFTDNGAVVNYPVNGSGQNVIAKAPNGNLLLLTATVTGPTMYVSSDGGKTWGDTVAMTISGIPAGDNPYTYPCDQGVVVDNIIYVTCIRYTPPYNAPYKMYLIKSTDSGATWSFVSEIGADIATGCGEAGIEFIGGTTFIVLIRAINNDIYRARSYDMGVTWSASVFMGWTQGGRWHIHTGAHLRNEANWWNDPVLIANGFVISGGGRVNCVRISKDKGATWTSFFAADVHSQGMGGYGDLIYNPNTSEYVLIEYFQESPNYVIKQYNMTISGI